MKKKVVNEISIRSGVHKFAKKSGGHLEILGARMVT
jgi:hypothetical protein